MPQVHAELYDPGVQHLGRRGSLAQPVATTPRPCSAPGRSSSPADAKSAGYLASTELYDPTTNAGPAWATWRRRAVLHGHGTRERMVLEAGGSQLGGRVRDQRAVRPGAEGGRPRITSATPEAAVVGKAVTFAGHDLGGVTGRVDRRRVGHILRRSRTAASRPRSRTVR